VPDELEEVAAESITEQHYVSMIFGFLQDADPSLAGHAIASVLCMVFEDGYMVRAMQEEGRERADAERAAVLLGVRQGADGAAAEPEPVGRPSRAVPAVRQGAGRGAQAMSGRRFEPVFLPEDRVPRDRMSATFGRAFNVCPRAAFLYQLHRAARQRTRWSAGRRCTACWSSRRSRRSSAASRRSRRRS
jgi:hypothetical protein